MKRNVYLQMMSLPAARRRFLSAFAWGELVGRETIPTAEALGRVTASPVFSVYSSPGYHGAAMDGFAVRAAETYGASEEHPLALRVGAQAHPVNTGKPLPQGTDAVIMIEQVHQPDAQTAEIRAAAFPWQHVRRVGEDIVARELILTRHHRLGAADVAALLTAGVFEVELLARPRVAIIPTGSELVDWRDAAKEPPPPGAIIETNSVFLASLVREAGGEPEVLPRQPDDFEAICAAVEQALASDAQMVVVNAGASAGSEDYASHVVQKLGRVLVHGVTMMPGKPTLLGEARGKPVVGSPGYPVSAWVCFDQLLRPALAAMQGQPAPVRASVEVTPARRMPSKLGQEEFVRVHLGRVGDQVVAAPLKRGAGAITSLTRADGILRIPAQSEGVDEGERAQAELLRGSADAAEHTLMIVGSHDVTLDLLADRMRDVAPEVQVSASNLGSLAGLMAIRDGRCHLGGTHLLDPDSGEYNVSYIQRHLPDVPVRLVTLARRQQGLMVKPGNPKQIQALKDLTRDGVSFINRQAGSGTRVLLDYHLQRLELAPAAIEGYNRDEYTHMAVAVQVLSGGADAGLGILAAARALNLDFIPIAEERYDLCIPLAHLDDPRVRALLEVLATPEFRAAVEALGGYDVSPMGQIAWES
jgi:molybdenum cofactor synthesis domain-containing protein